jgi:hypothetical protein
MASVITLEGLRSVGGNEDRALADIKVVYNSLTYNWQIYIPRGTTNLDAFIEASKPNIELDIDNKEAAWTALTPKTRQIEEPPGSGNFITVDIQKEEIVRADVPDYIAIRRNLYPPTGDQLDALWKGPVSPDYNTILDEIDVIKETYDPTTMTTEEFREYKLEKFRQKIQYNMDKFARNRAPFMNMQDACTYGTVSINTYRNRALYCIEARATAWKDFLTFADEVRLGTKPLPTNYAALKVEVPSLEFTWP